jgi:streptogramin lyase
MNLRRETPARIALAIAALFSISVQAQTIRECVVPQGAGGALTLGPDGNVWFIDGAAGCGTTPPGPGGASCGLGRVALDCTGYQHFPLPKGVVRRVTPSVPIPGAAELQRFGPVLSPLLVSIVSRFDPPGLGPLDVTTGADGNLWFANYYSGPPFIGRMTTKGEFTEFPFDLFVKAAKRSDPDRPAFGAWPVAPVPNEIEAGPDGRIYFSVQDQWSNAGAPTNDPRKQSWIGRFDPKDPIGTLKTWSVPGMAAGIIVGNDGNMWFTTIPHFFSDVNGGIGRIDTRNGAISFWPYPSPTNLGAKILDNPATQKFTSIGAAWTTSSLGAAPDGTIWFTHENIASIGRFSPKDGSFTYYTEGLRDGDWRLYGIVAGKDGNMYAAHTTSGDVYRISLDGKISIIENPVADPGEPVYMMRMPDGNIWTAGHRRPSIQILDFGRKRK